MRTFVLTAVLLPLLVANHARADGAGDARFVELAKDFAKRYAELKIPPFTPDYKRNLAATSDLATLEARRKTLESLERGFSELGSGALGAESRYLSLEVRHELDFELERVALEEKYKKERGGSSIPDDGLSSLPFHERWYRLYLKKITSLDLSPGDVTTLGESEVERIRREIKEIQSEMGFEGDDAGFYAHLNSKEFVITDEKKALEAFAAIRATVAKNLGRVVASTAVPDFSILPAPNATKDTPPAYYQNGVFYFNFYGGRFNRRALGWSFLHEAVPGHHYQTGVAETPAPVPEVRDMFFYQGYTEGWGAYCEDMGDRLGLYDDPALKLGKLEWDLVRSARLVIDAAVHGGGWSKTQALAYWKAHVPNQDDIAEREIDRVVRWPAQVTSYKVGEAKLQGLRKQAERRQGGAFSPQAFHALLLSRGSIPLGVLEEVVRDAY